MKLKFAPYIIIFLSLLFAGQSCSFTQKIKNGKMAYDRKQYYVAIDLLSNEFEINTVAGIKGEIAYFLAKSYQKINNNRASINWFKESYKLGYGAEALYDLGFALKQEELYGEAVAIFRTYAEEHGTSSTISREISICQLAAEWKEEMNEKEYQISPMNFNSGGGDYSATLYEDDFLVFTSDRMLEGDSKIYNWTGNAFSDLYISQKNGNQSRPFDRRINSEHNDGAACFNSQDDEMYFTRCFSPGAGDSYCKIMISFKRGNLWTDPRVLEFYEDGVNYGQPALSPNDSTLFFSCEHPDGAGGYDIYFSQRTQNGWAPPKILPSPINTEGDEKFPTVFGDTLFFSSNQHPGMGGLDIFKTFIRNDGQWQMPINLKAPINSGRDDFSFVIDGGVSGSNDILKQGYFSSSRQGKGNDDIFQFTQYRLTPETPTEEPTESTPVEEDITLYLAVKVVEKRYAEPENPNSMVIGKAAVKGAKVDMITVVESTVHNSGTLGFFVVELQKDRDYNFKAGKDGYLNNSISFSTRNLDLSSGEKEITYNLEIPLDRIYVDREINLSNIYYDFEKWDIRDDAKPSLDELSQILKDNPRIKIQLASHTDCRGTDEYNLDLSQKRAQSAVDYIISTGISPSRMAARGYGETVLSNLCECIECSEAEHQENRRTTFKIVEN